MEEELLYLRSFSMSHDVNNLVIIGYIFTKLDKIC